MDMQLIRSNFGVRSGLRSQIGLGFTWTVDSRGLAQSRIGPGRAGLFMKGGQIYMVLTAAATLTAGAGKAFSCHARGSVR